MNNEQIQYLSDDYIGKIVERATEQTSLLSDGKKCATDAIAEYKANCNKAMDLFNEGLLDYKTGLEGFISKYNDALTAYYQGKINTPSWFVTGRGNLNMNSYNKKQQSIHNKLENLLDILGRLSDKNVEEMRSKKLRKEMMPRSYKEKSKAIEGLLNIAVEIATLINTKGDTDTEYITGLMVQYGQLRDNINIWYVRNNRMIPELFFANTVPETWEYIIQKCHFITRSGKFSNKLEKHLKEKIAKMNSLAILYDNIGKENFNNTDE